MKYLQLLFVLIVFSSCSHFGFEEDKKLEKFCGGLQLIHDEDHSLSREFIKPDHDIFGLIDVADAERDVYLSYSPDLDPIDKIKYESVIDKNLKHNSFCFLGSINKQSKEEILLDVKFVHLDL